MHASIYREGATGRGRVPTIALRLSNDEIFQKLNNLAKEQGMSLNMAVNMLLGFAFNEVERQNKKFVPKIVFETKQN
ncbi:MAG TPA: hypothetical protein VFT53_05690 [Candidatus Saccharimonadales bacterium]|nr:hypothetical protein [Candidatus Saccharimonadales bacterium]